MTEMTLVKSFGAFAADIKLSHSIFALPFVGTGLLMAGVTHIELSQLVLIVLCMVSARSFAMGMNRFLDSDLDSANGRTANRAIPSGRLNRRVCLAWSLAFAGIFVFAATLLSDLAGWLAIPLLVVLSFYSFMKRISWLTHWYLGICLGLAPIAAQIALKGTVTLPVLLTGAAVALWTAGFDLLYSLQDRAFDVERGLHSVPAKFGPKVALGLSIASFVGMVSLLSLAGLYADVGAWYWSGLSFVALILSYEHWLVRDAWQHGVSKNISAAFFNVNALVSVAFFACSFMDKYFFHG